MVKKVIINLTTYNSKGYVAIILIDSDVTFLKKSEDALFFTFFCFDLLIENIA